jgi:hypothetical protein
MTRTTPERPLDIEAVIPELSGYRGTGTRLHPRPGTPAPEQSSVGGPLLWPADEPWPTCTVPHKRRFGERVGDVRLRRKILAEAWSRQPAHGEPTGPTEEELQVLDTLRRGRHAPWLGDTDPIPLMPVAQLYARDVPGLALPDVVDTEASTPPRSSSGEGEPFWSSCARRTEGIGPGSTSNSESGSGGWSSTEISLSVFVMRARPCVTRSRRQDGHCIRR